MPPTLDQQRARHAWESVQSAKSNLLQGDQKEYGRNAKKLPVRILTAGLGPALAFVEAKGKADRLLVNLSDWVLSRVPRAVANENSLLKNVISGDADYLRRATDETLAYLQWLTRFADAEGLTED